MAFPSSHDASQSSDTARSAPLGDLPIASFPGSSLPFRIPLPQPASMAAVNTASLPTIPGYTFQCDYKGCFKTFTARSALFNHRRLDHFDAYVPAPSPHGCDPSVTYQTKRSLYNHEQYCTVKHPFTPMLCSIPKTIDLLVDGDWTLVEPCGTQKFDSRARFQRHLAFVHKFSTQEATKTQPHPSQHSRCCGHFVCSSSQAFIYWTTPLACCGNEEHITKPPRFDPLCFRTIIPTTVSILLGLTIHISNKS